MNSSSLRSCLVALGVGLSILCVGTPLFPVQADPPVPSNVFPKCSSLGGSCVDGYACQPPAKMSIGIQDCPTYGMPQTCCKDDVGPPGSLTAPTSVDYGYEDPLGNVTVNELVARIIAWVLPVVGSLFLVMFIWGGILWFTAAGEEAKVKKARTTLVNAVIGMAIIMGAYLIVSNVIAILGGAIGQ